MTTQERRRRSTDVDPAESRAARDNLNAARVDRDRAKGHLERHTRDLEHARFRATMTAGEVPAAEAALTRARQNAASEAAAVTRGERLLTTDAQQVEHTVAAYDTAFATLVAVDPDAPDICRCYRHDGEPHPIHYGDPA